MNQMKPSQLLFDKQLILLKIMVDRYCFDGCFNNLCLGLNEPGIFRRAALVSLIKQVQAKYNDGLIEWIFIKNYILFYE